MDEIEPVYPENYSLACYSVTPTDDFDIGRILSLWPNTPERSESGWFINRYNEEIEYDQIGPFDPPDALSEDFDKIYIISWERWTGWTELLTIGLASDEYLSNLGQSAITTDINIQNKIDNTERVFETTVHSRTGFEPDAVIGRLKPRTKPEIQRSPELNINENLLDIINEYIELGVISEDFANQRSSDKLQNHLYEDYSLSPLEAESLVSILIWIHDKELSLQHIGVPTYCYTAILWGEIYLAASTVGNNSNEWPRYIETVDFRQSESINSNLKLDWLDPYIYGLSTHLAWYFIPNYNIGTSRTE